MGEGGIGIGRTGRWGWWVEIQQNVRSEQRFCKYRAKVFGIGKIELGEARIDLELGVEGVTETAGATVGGSAVGLARGGRGDGSGGCAGVEVGEDDALADGAAGDLAQGLHDDLGELRAGSGRGDEVETGDSAGEPEARNCRKIGGDGGGGEGGEDTDSAAAGLMDQLVEVVEGGIRLERGGQRGHGDDERIDAEGAQGIETGGDEFVAGGLLGRVGGDFAGWAGRSFGDLIEDGATPPGVGVLAEVCHAGTGEGLGGGEGECEQKAGCDREAMHGVDCLAQRGPVGSTEMVRGAASLEWAARYGR